MMGECRLVVEELLALCRKSINMDDHMGSELLEVVRNFEAVKTRWMLAEVDLKKYKELLVKSDVAKAALEVQLKHARNQLDVEMKKRYKMEADYQYLQRQMKLMCDILIHDSKSSSCLNDEQKSLLATFEHKGGNVTQQRSNKRLSVIDESSFLSHSDISYDRTDDDVDLDVTGMKPLRSRVREKRRSSMGPAAMAPVVRRGNRPSSELLEKTQEVETVESPVCPAPSVAQECSESPGGDQTSVWYVAEETEDPPPLQICTAVKTLQHVFLSKTVIRPETCSPCGKRIRFGKMAVRCKNCRAVAHPECKQKLHSCSTISSATGNSAPVGALAKTTPGSRPRIPQLIVDCVSEIERRGLQERGLYRVPGGGRLVKDLRDRYLQGKTPVALGNVQDVHVVCGLLKDFLRKLDEPLLTFKLHATFMAASELLDEDEGTTIFYQSVARLPKANRDTLAFLMLHLHKVMKSRPCEMDQKNLSRVFGPTIVGHGMSEPSPTTIMRDTNTQPKVVSRLLSLPEDYWKRVLTVHSDQTVSVSGGSKIRPQENGHGRLFEPLTSPELRGGIRGRITLSNPGQVETGRRFFTSPS